ncbi:26337_t:CDS:1, partial [Gigaspora margarita]
MEILITTGNYIIKHTKLGNCKSLIHEITSKQISDLHNRLNSNSPDGDFALLRLKQGIILANIDRKFWQDGNWDSLKKIWKFNLTCLTFLKAKRLGLTFQSLQEPWALHGAGEILRSMLGVKNFTKTCQALKG